MAGKRWNGTDWLDIATTRKRWNGSAWVDIVIAKRWNGTDWIDLFPDGPPVDPQLPTASWDDGEYSGEDVYECQPTDPDYNNCPFSYTFEKTKIYTVSAGSTVTGKPIAGVSYFFSAENQVKFYCNLTRKSEYDPVERLPTLLVTNAYGTIELVYSWSLLYFYLPYYGEIP